MIGNLTNEKAIEKYTELMRLISVGAYNEREPDGSYGTDDIEESIDNLDHAAAVAGLKFAYDSKDKSKYSLEPLTEEEKREFEVAEAERLLHGSREIANDN